jgi:hypothetical protein
MGAKAAKDAMMYDFAAYTSPLRSLRSLRFECLIGVLVALALSGCGDQGAVPAGTPSPTIAVAPSARPSPTPPGVFATRPPAVPSAAATAPAASNRAATALARTPAQLAATVPPAPFAYLWPAYLPPGMQLSPAETRVPREGETGPEGLGFFIATFASGPTRLVIGGGATDALPLSGEQRRVSVGPRAATLTTSGDRRQIVFDAQRGSLFVYSSGLSEEELLRVAGSLKPIDLQELRRRAGVP